MKRIFEEFTYKLNHESIDLCSECIRKILTEQKVKNSDITRHCLSAEEILLNYMDLNYENAKIKLTFSTRFKSSYFRLEIFSDAVNVFKLKTDSESEFCLSLLTNLNITPEYRFISGANTYTFRYKKERLNPLMPILISIISAIIIGMLGYTITDTVTKPLLENFIDPIYNTFFNILGGVSGPMIFLSVAWGIYGIGDASTLKKIGKRILIGFTGTVFLTSIITAILILPFFHLNFTHETGTFSGVSSLFQMILDIIPSNIFSPFVEGNTLQIIFLAIIIGIAMLFLGQQTTAVAKAVEQINLIVQFLIGFISKLVPFFIFIVIVRMIWMDSLSVFYNTMAMFGYFIFAVTIMFILIVLYTSLTNKINPLTLIRKGLPTFFIAITTSSSAASFGTNMHICRNRYGIDESVASFGLPLGMVTFKPISCIAYIVIAMFFAKTNNMNITISWYVIMLLISFILSVATPPIPGGALTAYTILFAHLGIPTESLAIVIACDFIFDFIDTGFDQFLLPMPLIIQANRLALLDKNTLHSKQ